MAMFQYRYFIEFRHIQGSLSICQLRHYESFQPCEIRSFKLDFTIYGPSYISFRMGYHKQIYLNYDFDCNFLVDICKMNRSTRCFEQWLHFYFRYVTPLWRIFETQFFRLTNLFWQYHNHLNLLMNCQLNAKSISKYVHQINNRNTKKVWHNLNSKKKPIQNTHRETSANQSNAINKCENLFGPFISDSKLIWINHSSVQHDLCIL